MSRFVTWTLGAAMMVAGSAATAEPAPTPSETKLVELLVQPESWFIEQLGGKRVVVDGQTLDPKIQYVLARYSAAPKPSCPAVDPAATPERPPSLRECAYRSWPFLTRVPAPIASPISPLSTCPPLPFPHLTTPLS